MKKAISLILIFTMFVSMANVAFADENKFAYNLEPDSSEIFIENACDDKLETIVYGEQPDDESCVSNREQLLSNAEYSESGENLNLYPGGEDISLFSEDYAFDSTLLTSFNTVTGPVAGNGANEPKFSYNTFLEENISDYSGELTLNFEDIVLEGRGGMDLRIGRTYQSVASNLGEKTIMVLPDENGYLRNILVNEHSTYLLDRYKLGMGWGFSFPSIQIETEYIPMEIADTYYYEEEKQLYYHSGNGEVYQVTFTSDLTDSNLKGYYNKDIQFNKDDTAYSNGQVTSYYSMTSADKTKQYFAEDGRLIGIVDRFGNSIKFEHELTNITNRVPEGNFKYDSGFWFSSESSDGTADAICRRLETVESNDNYVMHFRQDNDVDETYIMSYPIQINPLKQQKMGIRVKNEFGDDIRVDVIGYDTAYTQKQKKTFLITDYATDSWYDFTKEFSMSSAVRYIVIKISPKKAQNTYIDTVSIDEPKPLIKKITDSIGRTVDFSYSGDMYNDGDTGTVTLTITAPDGESTKTLTYNKEIVEFGIDKASGTEQRLYWYLSSSNTEGADGASVKYQYNGGATADEEGNLIYPKLYLNYNTKEYSASHSTVQNCLLSNVRYRDREKVYEYEVVRKHLGDGYYDTLRVKKKYDMYAYVPEGSSEISFKGETGAVNYSYEGTYSGSTFDNETGYPDYTFDDETNLNERWTVTKTGKSTDSVTFSNCVPVQQTVKNGEVTLTSDYVNHSTFKSSPVQIKNTVSQNGNSRETYVVYSYNSWGGIETESKEVEESIKNNPELLEKYTTTYAYNDDYHFVTQKSYYNNINSPQICERNTYDDTGRLTASENAAGEKINYYYENDTYDFLLTRTVQDDTMGLHNLAEEDRIIAYTYDDYALFPVKVSESYDGSEASTLYEYDYISGDVLKETLPDSSYTKYTYYSDGKVKQVIHPFVQYVNGQAFRTVETHAYNTYALHQDYNEENKVFGMDTVKLYKLFSGETTASLYAIEQNFYDAKGNLKKNIKYDISQYDENENYVSYDTSYYHDDYERLNKTVDIDENTVLYSYDGFDRLVRVTDSENNVYNYAYNNVQNKADIELNGVSSSENKKILTQYFDLYGNIVKNVVYPDNTQAQTLEESYEYDLRNNLISYTDANGNKTSYAYDEENRLAETILPNGVKATASYSAFGKPVFEKIYSGDNTEKSSRTAYRNEKGDLKAEFFTYNRRMTDADIYSTDAKGRFTSISEGENPKTVTYDQLDNPIVLTSGSSQLHRRYGWFGEVWSAATDESVTEVLMQYDALGNVAERLQDNEFSVNYASSASGRINQSKMPSERIESYTYTANGNLDTIVSDSKTFDYDYYDTGYVKSITYPGNLKTTYEYDNINRITKVVTTKNSTAINTFEYEYDSNGNTTKEIKNGAVTSYSYDALDRLISVTYSDGTSVSYEYDTLNNRTKETYSDGDVKDYVYDEKYQLKEIKLNGQITDTFTYNETGAVITHNDKTYSYDMWDRMSGYSDGTDTFTYKYDANGIRTGKNDKQYIIDLNNNVVAEADSTGAITDEILWGHQPLARKTNGIWYYYIYNAHGDVVGLVNSVGAVVNTYEYTPWGEIRSESETVENSIKYAGEYYDDELDMIYLRARYYNPQIGRFTSLDVERGEISNPLDMNRYVYCRNNPIKFVDPSGTNPALAVSIGVKLLAEAAPYIAGAAAVGTGILYYKEHTKGARGSTHDKHTKKRSGAPSKASKKSGWQDRSNKKKQ